MDGCREVFLSSLYSAALLQCGVCFSGKRGEGNPGEWGVGCSDAEVQFSSQPRSTGGGGGMGGHPHQPALNVFAFMNYCKCPRGEREGGDLQSLLKKMKKMPTTPWIYFNCSNLNRL